MKSAREEILGNLRKAHHPEIQFHDFEGQIYHPIEISLDKEFKKKLESIGGTVHMADSETELYTLLKDFLLPFQNKNICCHEDEICEKLVKYGIPFSNYSALNKEIEAGITSCEFLIAYTGSVMVSSAQKGGRQMFVYPPVHVIIARQNQLVDYLEKAYSDIQEKYKDNLPSHIALITGPSRTADIEKTLVMGAHGPKELHVFLF